MSAEKQAMIEAAQRASAALRDWFARVEGSADRDALLGVRVKFEDFNPLGYEDVFTLADQAAEDAIIPVLRQCRDIAVVAEESSPDCAELPDGAQRWLIDPLDGTSRFKQGSPDFSVTIALQTKRNGVWRTDLGVVAVPMKGTIYVADTQTVTEAGRPIAASLHTEEAAFEGTRGDILRGKRIENVVFSKPNKAMMDAHFRFNDSLTAAGAVPQSTFSTAMVIAEMVEHRGVDATVVAGSALDLPWDTDAAIHIAKTAGIHTKHVTIDGEPCVLLAHSKNLVSALESILRDDYRHCRQALGENAR